MKKIRRKLRKRKRGIERRLAEARTREDTGQPVFSERTITYDIGERTQAIKHGGVGLAHQISVGSGLVEAIDESVELLEFHRPYHESDHVRNIAYNGLCGGQRLQDIELRRQDEAFWMHSGSQRFPTRRRPGIFVADSAPMISKI